jgi:hypothetical protein
MSEHFLNASEVGSSLEQVRGEGMAQEVGMHAFRLQTGLAGQPPQDQEGSGPGQGPSLRVEEQLRSVPPIEVRPSERHVTPECVHCLAADRDHALLAALADRPDEPLLQIHACSIEPDRLADSETGAVEELDERPISEGARRRSGGRVDQALCLSWRKRPRQLADAAGKFQLGGRVLGRGSDEHEVAKEGADGGDSTRDRRRCESRGAELSDPPLELFGRRRGQWVSEPSGQLGQIPTVGLHGPRR